MRRIGKRGSRSDQGRKPTPIAVFDGSLRNLYDAVGLDVTLSLTGDQITVISDDGEMGTWPLASAAIRSFDSRSYEFYAEGDLLLFTPDDLIGFRTSPFVVGLPPDTEGRKRRAAKKETPAKPEPKVAKTPKKKPPVAKKTKTPKKPKKPKVKLPVVKKKRPRTSRTTEAPSRTVEKPSGSDRKAATPAVADEREITPVEPEPDHVETASAVEPPAAPGRDVAEPDRPDTKPDRESVDPAPVVRRPDPAVRPAAVEPAETPVRDVRQPDRTDAEPEQAPAVAAPTNGRMRAGVWIRALDSARRYDLFDLNRVPIDRSLRGKEHQHTWDHRVATAEGVAGRVCTICGKIRISTKPTKRSRRSKR